MSSFAKFVWLHRQQQQAEIINIVLLWTLPARLAAFVFVCGIFLYIYSFTCLFALIYNLSSQTNILEVAQLHRQSTHVHPITAAKMFLVFPLTGQRVLMFRKLYHPLLVWSALVITWQCAYAVDCGWGYFKTRLPCMGIISYMCTRTCVTAGCKFKICVFILSDWLFFFVFLRTHGLSI